MKSNFEAEVVRLRDEIERHNRLYYVHARPEIRDEEFDALLRRLEEIEKAHPELVTPDSPTQRVGGEPLEAFPSVEHSIPMLSMDNTYSVEELREFHGRVVRLLGEEPAYVAEPKIDGVSIALRYSSGRFVLGATRGDGRRGDDVTANLRTIRAIPLRLMGSPPPLLEVRGEIFFTSADFLRINEQRIEQDEVEFANPRNAAAGTLKMLDARLVATRPLRFMAWGFGLCRGFAPRSYAAAIAALAELGIPVNPLAKRFESLDPLIEYIQEFADRRHSLDYQVDGMVVKVDAFAQRDQLGSTSKAPRWQVAYKYAAEQAVTRVQSIGIYVGRTGALTPVAHLEPVRLAGTTVSRASLHNEDEIRRKDVREGDMVVVQKAGEIIPQVLGVKTEFRDGTQKEFVFPTTCPACGAPVHRDAGGVYIRCQNPNCPAQFKNILQFFANRHAMDIEGLGPALAEQLVERGMIRSLPDLYRLRAEDVAGLERMGAKSAANLIQSIEQSKERGLARLLAGLGIRHVGRRAAEILAEHFQNADKLADASIDEIAAVHEIGPVIAQSVHRYFHEQGGRQIIEELRALGVRLDERTSLPTTGNLVGKSFVVTGTLESMSRDEAHERIRQEGGRVLSSVSAKTDYLVAGEKPGSKLDKARKLGIAVLSESQFMEMLAGQAPK